MYNSELTAYMISAELEAITICRRSFGTVDKLTIVMYWAGTGPSKKLPEQYDGAGLSSSYLS